MESSLFRYTSYVSDSLERGLEVDVFYADFAKAFDSVNHSILLAKLSDFGIFGPLFECIRSFVVGRSQRVRIEGHFSSAFAAYSEVPQGTHLGPLLFLFFINDIGRNIKSNYVLYADDLKIYTSVTDDKDDLLQRDIEALEIWCHQNKLVLNQSKCKSM